MGGGGGWRREQRREAHSAGLPALLRAGAKAPCGAGCAPEVPKRGEQDGREAAVGRAPTAALTRTGARQGGGHSERRSPGGRRRHRFARHVPCNARTVATRYRVTHDTQRALRRLAGWLGEDPVVARLVRNVGVVTHCRLCCVGHGRRWRSQRSRHGCVGGDGALCAPTLPVAPWRAHGHLWPCAAVHGTLPLLTAHR